GRRFRHLHVPMATMRLHEGAKSVRALSAFAPEIVRIYERLAAGAAAGGLPGIPAAGVRRGMSSAHYRAAQCLFWDGRIAEARRHARSAWRLEPLRPRLLLAALLAGTAAHRALSRWRGN